MLKRTVPYAVELDGAISHHQDGCLQTIASLSNIKGDCRVLTDFQDAMARTMTVEADTRYVELMISRKLQETGEFDEPVTVITHWKKRRGKNLSDIFFTALPAKRYLQYVEWVAEHKDHLLVLPLQSILYTMLKKFGKDQPISVVLQHGRFADILVGTSSKVWFAHRVVAFDHSDEQISALWETIRSDIDAAGKEHRQTVDKVYVATWVDSGSIPQWSEPGDPRIIALDEAVMEQDGQQVRASLPEMIDSAPAGQAVASPKDKLFNGARRMLPAFNAILLIGALIAGGLGLWYHVQAAGRQARIQDVHQQLRQMRAKVPEKIEPIPFESTLEFVQHLWSSRKLPTYRQILADLSQGLEGALRVKNIKADYTKDKVSIKAYGTAHAPFETSYKAYQALRRRLARRGYQLIDDRFDTQINASDFVLQFAKELR